MHPACRSTSIPAPESTADLQSTGNADRSDSSGTSGKLGHCVGDPVLDPLPPQYVVKDFESANRTLADSTKTLSTGIIFVVYGLMMSDHL